MKYKEWSKEEFIDILLNKNISRYIEAERFFGVLSYLEIDPFNKHRIRFYRASFKCMDLDLKDRLIENVTFYCCKFLFTEFKYTMFKNCHFYNCSFEHCSFNVTSFIKCELDYTYFNLCSFVSKTKISESYISSFRFCNTRSMNINYSVIGGLILDRGDYDIETSNTLVNQITLHRVSKRSYLIFRDCQRVVVKDYKSHGTLGIKNSVSDICSTDGKDTRMKINYDKNVSVYIENKNYQ